MESRSLASFIQDLFVNPIYDIDLFNDTQDEFNQGLVSENRQFRQDSIQLLN
jgi:hypothetical protein